jgi:hypothetical protein
MNIVESGIDTTVIKQSSKRMKIMNIACFVVLFTSLMELPSTLEVPFL